MISMPPWKVGGCWAGTGGAAASPASTRGTKIRRVLGLMGGLAGSQQVTSLLGSRAPAHLDAGARGLDFDPGVLAAGRFVGETVLRTQLGRDLLERAAHAQGREHALLASAAAPGQLGGDVVVVLAGDLAAARGLHGRVARLFELGDPLRHALSPAPAPAPGPPPTARRGARAGNPMPRRVTASPPARRPSRSRRSRPASTSA